MASRKAGVITINLNAGTAQFVRDMDTASAKVKQFGVAHRGTVTDVQATSGALRVLEGNMTNNLRAAERFLANVLHVGPALQAAFPVVGAIALIGVVSELGKKVYEFVRSIEDAPEKIQGAFRELNVPLQATNDELQVTNDRLANDIAKLEGRPQNSLKLALDEAKLAADKLAEALDKDLANLNKLLSEQKVSIWRRLLGEQGVSDIVKEFGGQTGRGGFEAVVAGITHEGRQAIAAARTEKEKDAAQTVLNTKLLKAYGDELARVNQQIEKSQSQERLRLNKGTKEDFQAYFTEHPERKGQGVLGSLSNSISDQTARLEILKGVRADLEAQMDTITLRGNKEVLEGRKQALEMNREDMRVTNELREQLAKAHAEGLSGIQKVNAEEEAHILKLKDQHQWNAANAALIAQIYDQKRLDVFIEGLGRTQEEIERLADHFTHMEMSARKAMAEAVREVEEGKKHLEELTRTIPRLVEELNKLRSQTDATGLQHQVRMIGLEPGAERNPLGTLARQQALERLDIEKRYQEQLKLANTPLQRSLLLRQQELEIQKLQFAWEEKQAEVRQKGVRDFFAEMQGQAQSMGNIFYEAMHHGLDRVSNEFANLATGQKTNFGRMFQDLGHEMLASSIKSNLQRGLGEIGRRFGISLPTKADGSSEANALWVRPAGGAQVPGLGLPGAGGGASLPGRLGKIFGGSAGGFIFNLIPHAEGGSVSPGSAYLVGERGPEPFFPGTSGTIMSNAVARRTFGAGGNVTYAIDARGSELGVENRISRSLELVHASAVTNSVRADAERMKRTPQRTPAPR